MQKKSAKPYILIIIIFLILLFAVLAFLPKGKGVHWLPADESEDISSSEITESTDLPQEEPVIEDGTETIPEDKEENAPGVNTDSGLADMPEEINTNLDNWDGYMPTLPDSERLSPEDIEESIDAKPTTTAADKSIGNIQIHFNPENAYTSTTRINKHGIVSDNIYFTDGIENGLKGYMSAIRGDSLYKANIQTLDNAKDVLAEYFPSNSGTTSEWEETEHFFVRKIMAYDGSASAAYMFITALSKEESYDKNIYSALFITSGDPEAGVPIKETSFESISDALSELIPDSTLIPDNYADVKSELQYTLYYRGADETSLGGLDTLREARNEWVKEVYGVALDGSTEKTLNDLTEEEKRELYMQYVDPVGYAQEQIHKQEIEEASAEIQKEYEENLARFEAEEMGIPYESDEETEAADTEN